MRFLKKLLDFKKKEYEYITDADIQDIQDIFQDEVDEYDLISLHNDRASEILGDNIFNDSYHITYFTDYLKINIFLSKIMKQKLLLESIDKDFKLRLESIGYIVKVDSEYVLIGTHPVNAIKIEVRKTKTN